MTVLVVNSREEQCGVHQMGVNLFHVLSKSARVDFKYCAPQSTDEMIGLIRGMNAEAVLWNFYPMVYPWVNLRTLTAIRQMGVRQFTIFHEVPVTGFDEYIYADPTFIPRNKKLNRWHSIGRPLPPAQPERPVNFSGPAPPVISTSGFGFGNKGHARLTKMVCEQFQQARLRLHIPYAKYGDADGASAKKVSNECREIAKSNPGVILEISHSFKDPDGLVAWLSQSDLNCYLYDEMPGRGIASTTDHALAARKPIALTRTTMFRHLHQCEGIFVEESTLPEIMKRGVEPLRPAYAQNSPEVVLNQVEEIVLQPRGRGYNRLLTNQDREDLKPQIEIMQAKATDMMSRKIPEANVQQAWVRKLVLDTGMPKVFCVGRFEDTAFESLAAEFVFPAMHGIDPQLDMDLATYRAKFSNDRFQCVFATSVIEHVPDDTAFIRDLCAILEPDGVCILTADFKNGWKPGDPLPASNVRMYTPQDIARIIQLLESEGCYLVDRPNLEGAPDFHYQGHDYSFVSIVFKKL